MAITLLQKRFRLRLAPLGGFEAYQLVHLSTTKNHPGLSLVSEGAEGETLRYYRQSELGSEHYPLIAARDANPPIAGQTSESARC